MAIDFPSSPALNEIYTYGSRSWQWNGTGWDIYVSGGSGTVGATGATGPAGPTGPQGISGAIAFTSSTTAPAGATYGDMWFNTTSGNIFVYITDGTSSYWVEPFGPQGATGVAGTSGATGATGATGLQGIQGTTGNTGATGNNGTNGVTGNTGATGPQGIQGNTGPVGDYVSTFNGLTGNVFGVTVGGTNVFTALNTFNAGISASGGVTLAGTLKGTTSYFTGLLDASAGISASTLVVAGGSTFGAAVDHVFGLSNRGLKINAGKGSSEILSYGNEILSINSLGGNGTLELFGSSVTLGDDGNNDSTNIITDDSTQTITYSAPSVGHIFYGPITSTNNITAPNIVNSVNGQTGAVEYIVDFKRGWFLS